MILKHCKWLAACALLLATRGCVSPPAGGLGVRWLLVLDADGAPGPVLDAVTGDTWLAKKIKITPLGFTNPGNGIVALNIVESLASRPLTLEYRVDWLDEDGTVMPLDNVLWHSFILKPEESRFIGKPIPREAAGYRLTVRRAR